MKLTELDRIVEFARSKWGDQCVIEMEVHDHGVLKYAEPLKDAFVIEGRTGPVLILSNEEIKEDAP